MLIHGPLELIKDTLRNAVVFALFSLLAFYLWWDLNDEGLLVAEIVFAGIAVQQAYRYHRSKRHSMHGSSNTSNCKS